MTSPISLNKLGDFLVTRGRPGDADRAMEHFTRSLEIADSLLKANPDSAQATRDVFVSLCQLGVFLATRGRPGDADQALKHFARSLEIAESLLKANPDSAQAARNVSISLEKLGVFLATRGRPGDADQRMKHFTRDLEIAESLLKANPDSAQAARDVSVSLNKLGDLLAARGRPGDADQAQKHYTRSLEIRESLLKANPGSAQAARDVVVSHFSLICLFANAGDKKAETRHLRACYDILHPRIDAGIVFDPLIMKAYGELQRMFKDAASQGSRSPK